MIERAIRLLVKVALRAAGYQDFDSRTNGERRLLAKSAQIGDGVVLDVGANRGAWASMALTFHPQRRCTASSRAAMRSANSPQTWEIASELTMWPFRASREASSSMPPGIRSSRRCSTVAILSTLKMRSWRR